MPRRQTAEALAQRFRRFLANPSIPLAQRVRMACSIGAVFSALMGAGGMFGAVSVDEVAALVRSAIGDLFPAQG